MRDITNEALRRMYIACRNRTGFPGVMHAESEGNDRDVSIHAILQGLGLITNNEAENPCDEHDMGRRASGGIDAPILNAPSTTVPAVARSIVTSNLPNSLESKEESPHIGLVRSTTTSPTALSYDYDDRLHQAGQVSEDPEQLHKMDKSGLVPTTGWMTEQTAMNLNGVDDGTRPVNVFLPAWPGTFAGAAGSYDYNYAY